MFFTSASTLCWRTYAGASIKQMCLAKWSILLVESAAFGLDLHEEKALLSAPLKGWPEHVEVYLHWNFSLELTVSIRKGWATNSAWTMGLGNHPLASDNAAKQEGVIDTCNCCIIVVVSWLMSWSLVLSIYPSLSSYCWFLDSIQWVSKFAFYN